MSTNKTQPKLNIQAPIIGIGNVIGNNSSSRVEIKVSFLTINRVLSGNNLTEMEFNPNYTAQVTSPFATHPDATEPELEHLIGHKTELNRLLTLYDYALHNHKGAIVFLTGQYGYGTKALGRTFVDAVSKGGGRVVITRFWRDSIEMHTRRDPRWSEHFQTYKGLLEHAPNFLLQPDFFPFWAIVFQLYTYYPKEEIEKLPSNPKAIPAYFRKFTLPSNPLLVLLEDFDNANGRWREFLQYLLPELNNNLPILFLATIHCERPLLTIDESSQTLMEKFAIELATKNNAEVYYLSRISQGDIEEYIAPSNIDVAERLSKLTNGLPILVQDVWRDWLRNAVVTKDSNNKWQMAPDTPWLEFGTGRDYIQHILDALWPLDEEAPWSAEKMFSLLSLAAQEGPTFTIDAISSAFGVEKEELVYGLEFLLDEPDDPGLVKEAEPSILCLPSANWQKKLERFTFSPLLVWYSLKQDFSPDAQQLKSLAEKIRIEYWPFIEKCALVISRLYEKSGDLEQSKRFYQLIKSDDRWNSLIISAELLISYPVDFVAASLLWSIADELIPIAGSNLQWANSFYSRLLSLAVDLHDDYFLARATSYFADVKYCLGELKESLYYFEKALSISKKIMDKLIIANCLSGLSIVHDSIGNTKLAYAISKDHLKLREELGDRKNIALALGQVASGALNMNLLDLSYEYQLKALNTNIELDEQAGIAINLYELGWVRYKQKKMSEAADFFTKALSINQNLGRKEGETLNLIMLGNIDIDLKKYDNAKEYILRALAISEGLDSKMANGHCLESLGDISKGMGHLEEARKNYENALSIYNKSNSWRAKMIVDEKLSLLKS